MLKVPSVHVVELVQVRIIAGHDPHGNNRGYPCTKEHHVAHLYFAGETANETTFELVVVALRLPSPGVARPDEPHPVPQEYLGIGPGGRTPGQLPDRLILFHRCHDLHLSRHR